MASRGWAHGVGRAMFSSVSGTGHGLPRAHSALGRMRLPVATEPSARHRGVTMALCGPAWHHVEAVGCTEMLPGHGRPVPAL